MQTAQQQPTLPNVPTNVYALQPQHPGLGAMSLLEQLATLVNDPNFAHIGRAALTQESYDRGEWCVSDLIRLSPLITPPILDVLMGVQTRKHSTLNPALRPRILIPMHLVYDEDFPFETDAPPPDAIPITTQGNASTDDAHHIPSQWTQRVGHVYRKGVPIVLAVYDDYPPFSAHWVLQHHGWATARGGTETRRWIERTTSKRRNDPSARRYDEDQWVIVEDKFLDLHPDLAPTAEDLARGRRKWLDGEAAKSDEAKVAATVQAMADRIAALETETAALRNAEVEKLRAENAALRTAKKG